ncbi:MAG TPA: aldo/keto reductase [Rhizomicrobium sp.]|jgi:L-glyceraldehyde 3-phosphate reductase
MSEPAKNRYENMQYRHCGRSGLKLPAISLGAWETFGGYRDAEVARQCLTRAFDLGITHFDFANNYGNPPGNAELVCGRVLKEFPRDEILVATKAGFPMWPGPYGDGGSRKYLIASCDQSLKRLGVDYVDIFYHHRPDPRTPIEESIGALATLIQQGKALYAGVSSYSGEQYLAAVGAAKAAGIRIAIHQPYFNLLGRRIEKDLLPHIAEQGSGVIAFCPLASGLLTDKHLDGNVPAGDRGGLWPGAWVRARSQAQRATTLNALNAIAKARGQSLAQMSLAWILHHELLTSVAVGASRVEQVEANVKALDNLKFDPDELAKIDQITEEPVKAA